MPNRRGAAGVGVGTPKKEKKRLHDLLDTIVLLKHHGLCETGVIGAYHARRVTPLMARALSLYKMTTGAQLDGTVLAQGVLRYSEIVQRIKEVTKESDATFLILGHTVMRPDTIQGSPVEEFFLVFFPSQPFDPVIQF
jgi:hypothetical protein